MVTGNTQDWPWYKEYQVFGIPKSLKPYPQQPVYHLLEEAARRYPKRGLIQSGFKMKYPEVKDHVDRLAGAMCRMGFEKGDRVATILPTSIQFVIADYAISRAGLVHVPMNHLESIDTMAHKLSQARPKALICYSDYLNTVRQVVGRTRPLKIIATEHGDYSNHPPQRKKSDGRDGILWMVDIIAGSRPEIPPQHFDVEKDLELILFTGGTTGLPKGCMLTHHNVYANSMQSSNAMGHSSKLLRGGIAVLLGLPFAHSYGHIIMHTMTYQGFDQILISDPRNTEEMIAMAKKYRPVLQVGVPTQFMKLAAEAFSDLGILGLSGSAPLPPSTQQQFEKKSGGGIMEGYGLSEMSPVTHLNTSFLLRILGGRAVVRTNNMVLRFPGVTPVINRLLRLVGPTAVGWILTRSISMLIKFSANEKKKSRKREKRGTTGIPAPDTDIKLIDIENGTSLTAADMLAGKQGELCLKGPQRMLGYWPIPGSGLDEDGYVRTNDIVRVDENGYFTIVDRTKDMIIVSGYKVYSRELDDLLMDHEGIEMAAVIGIPDVHREGSERVAAFIQPKREYQNKLTEEEIVAYLRSRVAAYAVPKVVVILDNIPLTEVQKVDKKVLRQMYTSGDAGDLSQAIA